VQLSRLYLDFFNSERSGGIVLIACTVLSLILSNSDFAEQYAAIWNYQVSGHSVVHWINDGLMTIFFLLIGLELEREIYKGELSDLKSATFPMIAALGGMIVPASIYMMINNGHEGSSGAGIPMATDIAFAIGILSLTGKLIPPALKVFLTALAVIDDLGAIIVIALFYSNDLNTGYLFASLGVFAALLLMNRLKVRSLAAYLLPGIAMWYFMLHSGVHATITGVLLAFAIPFFDGRENTPSSILQRKLHYPVAFIILPVFALANTNIQFDGTWMAELFSRSSLGIMLGLMIGKPAGIVLFALAGTLAGICSLPASLNWKHIIGTGMLGGIGFTMSIFITLLAFDDPDLISSAKAAILIASFISGLCGFFWLRFNSSRK
jgi:Na+:H+ antiporter, NhaA family